MKTQIEVKHKNRIYVCDVIYLQVDSDKIIQSVKVQEIRLFDGTIIIREWFADRGWADMVDFLLWDEIEWDVGRLLDVC